MGASTKILMATLLIYMSMLSLEDETNCKREIKKINRKQGIFKRGETLITSA